MSIEGHQRTLASCCLLSSKLYKIASPILWNRLRLTARTVDPEDGKKKISEEKKSVGKIRDRQKNSKRLREHVRTLSLFHHSPYWCHSDSDEEDRKLFELPNLHTLHLHLRDDGCIHDGPHIEENCRILEQLKPKTLVIHNTDIISLDLDKICIPNGIFKNVEIICLISPAYDRILYPGIYNGLPKLPSLIRVFWLFTPSSSKITDCGYWYQTYKQYLATLALQTCSLEVPFTIINSGVLGSCGTKDPIPAINSCQNALAVYVKQSVERQEKFKVNDKNQSAADKRPVSDLVNFVSLKQFLEEEDWSVYLEKDEVERWVQATHRLIAPMEA
ncbi:uncharacterized protein L201_001799 [Kwoniella dendrophila CBS 6074]|uniref:Uncharacterized protein n=1 Tax=Kwoniella dendrophila CBS 6074 TaxID=1295534 RepID=A0AAX4JNC5_9TREE